MTTQVETYRIPSSAWGRVEVLLTVALYNASVRFSEESE